jgi:hypothetical protein
VTALLALALIGWRARRRGEIFARRQWTVTALLVLLPWGVAAAAYRMSPDDKWPPPAMTNANGTPAILADDTRIDATPLGATYALPLRVEMGKVTPPDEHQNLLIEVYFRRLEHIPRATTMFVHIERRKDQPPLPKESEKDKDKQKEDFYNADHQVVGGSFYLSDAPEGRLIHDAIGAHIEKAGSGAWDVWVAFGDVSGRKGRARVADPGQATVDHDRVRVGSFVIP